jgi:hypothetical protein
MSFQLRGVQSTPSGKREDDEVDTQGLRFLMVVATGAAYDGASCGHLCTHCDSCAARDPERWPSGGP